MVWYWVLGIVLTILSVWFWRWGTAFTPIYFDENDTMRKVLKWVMYRGVYKRASRGSMTISLKGSEGPRLTFEKTLSHGEPGVRALVSERVVRDLYGAFAAQLSKRGIPAEESGSAPQRELSINVGKDFGLALVLAQTLFQDVAGRDLARDCVGRYDLIAIKNAPNLTGVDVPDEDVWF